MIFFISFAQDTSTCTKYKVYLHYIAIEFALLIYIAYFAVQYTLGLYMYVCFLIENCVLLQLCFIIYSTLTAQFSQWTV